MDHICGSCGAAPWPKETEGWCCDAGKTEIGVAETPVDADDDTGEGRADTSVDETINPDEKAINDILHSLKPGMTVLTDDYNAFRSHNAQYNNAAAMASQQVTINHTVAPYTCSVQGKIATHMPAAQPEPGER